MKEKKIFNREDLLKIAPSRVDMKYANRYFLPKSAPVDLEKMVIKAKGAGYSKDSLRLAWYESLDNKLKNKPAPTEQTLNFQEAIDVYFEKLSYYEMNRFEVAFNNFVNS